MNKKVLIQILNYNSEKYIPDLYIKCIESLKNQTYSNIDILIIDNKSEDNSIEKIHKLFPEIKILKLNKNYSTMGHNFGIKKYYKKYDYILIANNDIIFENDFIENSVLYMEKNKDIGIITPFIIMLDKKTINSTGIIMNKSGYAWDRDFGKNIKNTDRQTGEVLFASGGAMFVRTEVFNKIKGFDNIYFAYYEDTDFSIRVRMHTKYNIVFLKSAKCYHKFSGSWEKHSLKKEFFMMRNRFFFVIIHFPPLYIVNALRYLFFTSSTGDKKTNQKVYFSIFLYFPLLLIRRCTNIPFFKKFPKKLIENYHGYPKM